MYFLDPEARLLLQRRLPDAVSEIAAGPGHWYVGGRDGAVYAFSVEGSHLWNQIVPYGPRDRSINAELGLPLFQPYLNLGADGPGVAIGVEDELSVFNMFGYRMCHWPLPSMDCGIRRDRPVNVPLHEERLGRLGIPSFGVDDNIRTGYLRLALDTTQEDGWVKQVEVLEDPDGPDSMAKDPKEVPDQDDFSVLVPFPYGGINVLRSSWHSIFVGTRDGFLHSFTHDGLQQQTFQLGPDPVTDILADHEGIKAAYSGGRLTLFNGRQITGSVVLPEHFADLAFCGEWVLAWRWKSAWLVGRSGQVIWVGETEKPIRSAWGDVGGFCLLAGQLLSMRHAATR